MGHFKFLSSIGVHISTAVFVYHQPVVYTKAALKKLKKNPQ